MKRHARKVKKMWLRKILRQEVDKLAAHSAHDLRRRIHTPLCYEVEAQGLTYQVEAEILEVEPEYVHVLVGVDDGSLLRNFSPLSTSFLVYTDGRVDK